MVTLLKNGIRNVRLCKICNQSIWNMIMTPNSKNISFFKCKPKEDPFIICRATPEDTEEILCLMWDAYHPDEPTTASLGLGRHWNAVFDERASKTLAKGFSVVARCKYNGNLVGAALNDVTCPWDPDHTEKLACTMACPKIMQLYMFWAYLQRAPKLWDKYCQLQIFEIENVFVKPEDRRKGLARKLMKYSRDLGADAAFRLIRVDATNVYSACVCERLKMKMVYEIPYCSYVGEDGEPIFKTGDVNKSVKVYVDTPHAYKK